MLEAHREAERGQEGRDADRAPEPRNSTSGMRPATASTHGLDSYRPLWRFGEADPSGWLLRSRRAGGDRCRRISAGRRRAPTEALPCNQAEREGKELDSMQSLAFVIVDDRIVEVRIFVDDPADVEAFWAG